ncbi:MAG: tRNA uridine-5-carboxymethylaminomethyl(34) synthesis enzyme MnmG [Clostridia bacterium]|nr:tRNA uridine-5-carboxymethylaminomethyl(34) synthesis enzyme MnmG [Clostridia bacterium]
MENKFYEAIIIGAGHAGVESALSLARKGHKTLLLTISLDAISFMACNPSIGGTSKGQLVSEIDALGGQMGISADDTSIQVRMLNLGKGPAVQSLRSQQDKEKYSKYMKSVLENTPNLHIKQAEVVDILTEDGKVKGVKTVMGQIFECKTIVVATGVYLKAKIIIGDYTENIGPNGFKAANGLTQSLIDLGLKIRRFKTGTPPRIHLDSIDLTKLEIQKGDEDLQCFSFKHLEPIKNKRDCYLLYTNENTHNIIKNNLDRAPMYNGLIEGIGPRYCPSIETKIVRFADKERHQLFLEPEALSTKEMYLQGFSTAMPYDVQEEMVKSLVGFENAQIMRDSYAIEYDCIDSTQLYPTLMYKNVSGLFFAGQINGTSGYEEAGCQGLMAGINAALYLEGKEGLVLRRDQAYIGVLIDDLVTKGTDEPYRMMTSRAEHRLILRQDNADLRLTEIGKQIGLVDDERYQIYKEKVRQIEEAKQSLHIMIKNNEKSRKFFEDRNEPLPFEGISVESALKRFNINIYDLNDTFNIWTGISKQALRQVEIDTKYQGYIQKQNAQIEKSLHNENILIPSDLDYKELKGLRLEAIQKLDEIKPSNIGQASRISGVSPADISVLMVYINMKKNK